MLRTLLSALEGSARVLSPDGAAGVVWAEVGAASLGRGCRGGVSQRASALAVGALLWPAPGELMGPWLCRREAQLATPGATAGVQ